MITDVTPLWAALPSLSVATLKVLNDAGIMTLGDLQRYTTAPGHVPGITESQCEQVRNAIERERGR